MQGFIPLGCAQNPPWSSYPSGRTTSLPSSSNQWLPKPCKTQSMACSNPRLESYTGYIPDPALPWRPSSTRSYQDPCSSALVWHTGPPYTRRDPPMWSKCRRREHNPSTILKIALVNSHGFVISGYVIISYQPFWFVRRLRFVFRHEAVIKWRVTLKAISRKSYKIRKILSFMWTELKNSYKLTFSGDLRTIGHLFVIGQFLIVKYILQMSTQFMTMTE